MKKNKKIIVLIELVIFLLPHFFVMQHSFENYLNILELSTTSSSKKQHNHRHDSENCKICNFTFSNFVVSEFTDLFQLKSISIQIYHNYYNFLFRHKKLHFSLRAPPNISLNTLSFVYL